MSSPTTEFDLPFEDLEVTINRKDGKTHTISLPDLQLLADTHYDAKIDYPQVLKKIQKSLLELFDLKLSIAQVEWLYMKKREIELQLKKSGTNESNDSSSTDSSTDSSTKIPLDQWVDETANISSS